MNSKQQEKKQRKKSTGNRFEVTPLKSPPNPRRLKQFQNSDGLLLFPITNSNIPYKLRKNKVSQYNCNKTTDSHKNVLIDMEIVTK